MNTATPWPHAEHPLEQHPTLREVQEFLYRFGLTGPHGERHEPTPDSGGDTLHGGYEAAICIRCSQVFIRAFDREFTREDNRPVLCGRGGCE